jgi:hypothetical protein
MAKIYTHRASDLWKEPEVKEGFLIKVIKQIEMEGMFEGKRGWGGDEKREDWEFGERLAKGESGYKMGECPSGIIRHAFVSGE